jgi:hypothetical protein
MTIKGRAAQGVPLTKIAADLAIDPKALRRRSSKLDDHAASTGGRQCARSYRGFITPPVSTTSSADTGMAFSSASSPAFQHFPVSPSS